MKTSGPTGWRGVMNQGPRPSDFGLSPLADNVDSLTQRHRVRISRIRHGIGGGMRFSDETELMRAAPSRFSGEWMGRRLSLTGPRVLLGVYVAMLIASILIVHVHLRFEIRDMNMQQHVLQTVHRQLERDFSHLERHVTHLRDIGRLKEYAVMKLEMVEIGSGTEIAISPAIREKYSAEAIAGAQAERAAEIAARTQPAYRNPFRRLADLAVAFASPVTGKISPNHTR